MNSVPLFDISRNLKAQKTQVLGEWGKIFDSTSFTSGEHIAEFEKQFAKLTNTKYALGVSSGTISLILALKALGIKNGDEVITTPLTFAATTDAIVLVGAKPVFVDARECDGNIDPSKIAAAITSKTKAILLVHLYGVPCRMKEILAIAKRSQLKIIEDASHAHGSLYQGKPVGSLGDIGCFSLYPSKSLGSVGNAGVLVTNNLKSASVARMLAHHGISSGGHKYHHQISGFNALMDNFQAAYLCLNMQDLKKRISFKKKIAQEYNQIFQALGQQPMYWEKTDEPSLYVYSVLVKNRIKFQEFMRSRGVETGVYYPIPMHLQNSMKFLSHKKGDFPVAEYFCKHVVSLPIFFGMRTNEIEQVKNSIKLFFVK